MLVLLEKYIQYLFYPVLI